MQNVRLNTNPTPVQKSRQIAPLSFSKIRKQSGEFLPTSSQQRRQFETDLDLFNPSNTREIDNTKLESSRFQDNLFNQAAGALNFSHPA